METCPAETGFALPLTRLAEELARQAARAADLQEALGALAAAAGPLDAALLRRLQDLDRMTQEQAELAGYAAALAAGPAPEALAVVALGDLRARLAGGEAAGSEGDLELL